MLGWRAGRRRGQPVDGHALLQHSDPAAGATVASAPPIITLTFGEAPDPRLSSARVLSASGKNVAAGPAVAVAGSPNELQVPLPHLDEGVYTVAWRTVSEVDGHTAVGSFAFGVGVDPGAAGTASTTGATTSPSAAPPNSLARFLLLAGLVVLFGTGFVGWFVHPRPPRSLLRLAALGWLMFAVGTVGVIGFQISDAGADPLTFLGTALGAWDVGRLVTVAAAAIAVGVATWRRTSVRAGMAVVTVAAAAAMLVEVLTGHAAAAGLVSLQVLAQLVHLLAVGLWMGGLVALLLSVRGETSEDKAIAVRRFSRWAGVWLVALAASGAIRAVNELGTLDALTSTDFGRLLIVKTSFFAALGLLGALNHFWSVPAAVRTLGRLRRVGRLEIGIAIMTLVVTGFLVNLAPPASSAAAAPAPPQPLIAAGHDAGTSVRVRLVVTPGGAGINDFSAAVTDFDSGAPVDGIGPEPALPPRLGQRRRRLHARPEADQGRNLRGLGRQPVARRHLVHHGDRRDPGRDGRGADGRRDADRASSLST